MDWDKEEVYDREIAPLMQQVIEICKKNKLPMVAQFQYSQDGEYGDGYVTTSLPFEEGSKHIKEMGNIMRSVGAAISAISEEHVTTPDGKKQITIRKVL